MVRSGSPCRGTLVGAQLDLQQLRDGVSAWGRVSASADNSNKSHIEFWVVFDKSNHSPGARRDFSWLVSLHDHIEDRCEGGCNYLLYKRACVLMRMFMSIHANATRLLDA